MLAATACHQTCPLADLSLFPPKQGDFFRDLSRLDAPYPQGDPGAWQEARGGVATSADMLEREPGTVKRDAEIGFQRFVIVEAAGSATTARRW